MLFAVDPNIEITVPYHLYFNLLDIVGRQPSRIVAPLYRQLEAGREDATTDDITYSLYWEDVYRLVDMLALAPASESADLYLIFADALERRRLAVLEAKQQREREIRDREAPLRKALDEAARSYEREGAEPRPADRANENEAQVFLGALAAGKTETGPVFITLPK